MAGASHFVRTFVDALLAATLAPECAVCSRHLDAPLDGPVCDNCWTQVRLVAPPLCRTCGDPLPSWRTVSVAMECCATCRRLASDVDQGFAAGEYEGSLRKIIHAFKYEGRRSLARPLAQLAQGAAGAAIADVDCVVPVPLHPWRQLRRGFNQAHDLAAALGPPVVSALRRTRATAPQSGLNAAARRRNVGDAFGLSPLLSHRACDTRLRHRIVMLVDDVKTTGATLNACARVLKENAGVREVRAVTIAVRTTEAVFGDPRSPSGVQ